MSNLLFVLGVVFVVLKLVGIISWSWVFVLLPCIPSAIALVITLVIGLAAVALLVLSK